MVRSPFRSLIRLLLLLLVLAGIAPFVLPLNDGKPLLQFSDLRLPEFDIPAWTKTVKQTLEATDQAEPRTVYRWQGDDGATHYGEQPPADGRAYQAVTVDPNTNLMEGLRAKAEAGTEDKPRSRPAAETNSGMPLALNPDKIKATLDDARAVEDKLKERKALQDKTLDALQ